MERRIYGTKKNIENILTPLTSKAQNKMKIYGFDVETEHIRNDFLRKSGKKVKCLNQKFVMGSVIGKDTKKIFWNREEMREYLLSRKFMGSMILATNLEFDFNILYHDRLKDFKLIYRHGLIAAIKTEEQNNRRRRWVFGDTNNYIKTSLDKLGRILNVPKAQKPACMEVDKNGWELYSRRPKNDIEKKELEAYNIRDSTITYLFGENFKEFCTQNNMKLKLTIGSTGLDFLRRNYIKQPLKREPEQILQKHFLGSFRGGMTITYKRGTYNDKLYYYDYRSSYSGVMLKGIDRQGNYPNPNTVVYRRKGTHSLLDEYEGISKATVHIPYDYNPMLSVKTNTGKLIFPYGKFSGWFTNYELRKAIEDGANVELDEMIYYYNNWKPFKKAVVDMFELRKQYKKTKHPYEAMVKTLMNSGFFGKWGTNFNNMEEIISMDEIYFNKQGQAVHKGTVLNNFSLYDNMNMIEGFVTVKKAIKPFNYSFPILSSYTTMLGRLKLWGDVRGHHDKLVYSDTDSAIMTHKVFSEGFELGDWELENVCSKGIFIKPKFYAVYPIDDKPVYKSKGVGRFMSSEETFMMGLNKRKVSMEKFSRMKESNRIGIRSGSVMKLLKNINLDDDKRDWKGRRFKLDDWQDSEPIKLIA